MKKIITIAIPTYNRAEQLEASICELLKILPAECCVLVSDNGSTDSTLEVCKKFSKSDAFEFLENEKNEGYDKNVLKLLLNIRTDYVWFLSDDDRITEDLLSIVCQACTKGECAGILIDAQVMNENNHVVIPTLSNIQIDGPLLLEDKHLETMYKWSTLISSIVVRSDLAKSNIGMVEKALGTLFIQLPIFWLSCLGEKIFLVNSFKIKKYIAKKNYFETSVFDVWLWNLIDVGRVLEKGGVPKSVIKIAQSNIYGATFSMSGLPAHYILSRFKSKVAQDRSVYELFDRVKISFSTKLLIILSTLLPQLFYVVFEKIVSGLRHGIR